MALGRNPKWSPGPQAQQRGPEHSYVSRTGDLRISFILMCLISGALLSDSGVHLCCASCWHRSVFVPGASVHLPAGPPRLSLVVRLSFKLAPVAMSSGLLSGEPRGTARARRGWLTSPTSRASPHRHNIGAGYQTCHGGSGTRRALTFRAGRTPSLAKSALMSKPRSAL